MLLVPCTDSVLQVALHRLAEVCIGIWIALILTIVSSEREETIVKKTSVRAFKGSS